MRKILALAIVALMASPAMGAWIAASMGSGGFSEDFNGMAYWEEPAVGSPPTEYNWDTEEYDCVWQVTQNSADVTYLLKGVERWPTNAGFNTGQFSAWWASPDDRSIGAYTGDNQERNICLKLVNATGAELTEIYIGYNHEQWLQRTAGKPTYSGLDISSDAGATWQNLNNDIFTAPVQTKSANHWINGNAVGNFNAIKATYTLDNAIANNAEFLVKWNLDGRRSYDYKQAGSSIDNVIVVPEPATLALMGLGLAGLAIRRRK